MRRRLRVHVDFPRGKASRTHLIHKPKPCSGRADSARPNVLVGHFPRQGRGVEDDYLIHDNFFYQNRHESLFQGEGNVVPLTGNLFVNDVRRCRSSASSRTTTFHVG